MPQQDLYETLGVSRESSQEEIRKAYLKLAHKYHPDKTGGDVEAETKLKEINAAYDVLKSPDKRKQYDRFGSADGSGFGGGGFGGGGPGGAGFEAPFEDFFDVLFGQGKGRRGASRAQAGHDLEYPMSISLEDAAFGAKKTIKFKRMENCNECSGTGAAAGSKPETCTQCNGQGQVRVAHGFFSVTRPCPACNGLGQRISNPCPKCSGKGRIKSTRELSIDIPAGVDTGARLRVSGEGEPGSFGGPRGDLYIAIQVKPHEIFERDGTTIYCEVPITMVQASLGASIRVPTLHGEAELKITPGTQSGANLRLRGQGIQDLRGYRQGDQIVKIQVETPTKLSSRQKELLKEFEEISDQNTHPLYKKFFDRLKKFQG